ncbi:recombinase family protein [Nocardia sp. NPDC004750]
MDQHPAGGWDLGYARVSSTKQSLGRQLAALAAAGIPHPRIYMDKKTGATVDPPGLIRLVAYARPEDRIAVHRSLTVSTQSTKPAPNAASPRLPQPQARPATSTSAGRPTPGPAKPSQPLHTTRACNPLGCKAFSSRPSPGPTGL